MTLVETLEQLEKLILDRAPISEQRGLLHTMREQLEAYDQKTEALTKEITALKRADAVEITQPAKQLPALDAEEIWIHRMIEFRRGNRTKAKWAAFCPKCHMPVGVALIKGKPMALCSAKCGWSVLIPGTLESIISELDDPAA